MAWLNTFKEARKAWGGDIGSRLLWYQQEYPYKEGFMSKLGYFFAGVVAGATALTAAAFMVDDVAHKLDAASDDEGDSEDAGSNGSADDAEDAGETGNPAM